MPYTPPPPPTPAPPPTFAQVLKEARAADGISQAGLATLIDARQADISHWERGTLTPRKVHYEKLVELFPQLANAPKPATAHLTANTIARTTPPPAAPTPTTPTAPTTPMTHEERTMEIYAAARIDCKAKKQARQAAEAAFQAADEEFRAALERMEAAHAALLADLENS